MGRYAAVALVGIAMLGWHLESGSAKPRIVKDGKIHACYKVKGKPRGALRVVKGRKGRCRRGERKVSWRVRPLAPVGSTVVSVPPPVVPPDASDSDLAAEVASLSSRVASLEERVTTMESTLAAVESLCEQTAELTALLSPEPFACAGP